MNFKNRKIIKCVLIILLVLNAHFILYLFNFKIFIFNENFYKKEFQKYGIYSELKGYDVEKANNDVLEYFKNKDILIKNDFFNEREKMHLKDVKYLIRQILFAFYFSIILFLILSILLAMLNKNIKMLIKNFGVVLLFSGLLVLFEGFIFWLMLKLNFNFAFELMHKTFFMAGTYIFNPSFEKITILYPQEFFYDIAVNIAINTLVFSFFLFLAGLFIVLYFGIYWKKK